MLRAIGMSRRQVRTMIRYEAVITALIGAMLGMVIGIDLRGADRAAAEGRRVRRSPTRSGPWSCCSCSLRSPASSPRSRPHAAPRASTSSSRCSTSSAVLSRDASASSTAVPKTPARAATMATTLTGGPPWIPVSWTATWPLPRAISQRLTGIAEGAGDDEGEGEAAPEEEVAEAGVQRAGDDEDDQVVDDLHRRDAEGVGGERDRDHGRQRQAGPQQREAGQRVAEERRRGRSQRAIVPRFEKPSAVPIAIPAISPSAQPVRQWRVALIATAVSAAPSVGISWW